MRIKLIACEVFVRELSLVAARSPHVFDSKFMPFGLHNTPTDLRIAIQSEVDEAEGKGYDRIVLGYGLCSRGTAEVRARSIPIVIARGHDCITHLLGSRSRYSEEFSAHPGTYYYSPGWIERRSGEVRQGFVSETHEELYANRFEEYLAKYGEDNAKYLIEQESQWLANYTRVALIVTGIGPLDEYRRFTRKLAEERGWEYAELTGDMTLINRLADGDWDSEDFLTVEPGQSIAESFDELVIKAVV